MKRLPRHERVLKKDVKFQTMKETVNVGGKSRERVTGVCAYHEPTALVVTVRGSVVARATDMALEKLRCIAKIEAAGRRGPVRRKYRHARSMRRRALVMAEARYA